MKDILKHCGTVTVHLAKVQLHDKTVRKADRTGGPAVIVVAPITNIISSAVAFGGSIGAGYYAVRWMVVFIAQRHDRRQAQLDAEHSALDGSWKGYRLTLEQRVARLEVQNNAFRLAFQHVSAALIRSDPTNPALALAEQQLARAFPLDMTMAADRATAAVDLNDEKEGRP